MFGPRMWVSLGDGWLQLRPFEKIEMCIVAKGFQGLDVHMYTNLSGGKTQEDEEEWFEKIRKEEDSYIWAIVPDEAGVPIGVTGIHGVNQTGGCHTGIVIWNKLWWGKGIASHAHLARTLFAADYLNRMTMSSCVWMPNDASRKALLRVGYILTGTELRTGFREGKFIDMYIFSWIHPERLEVLYPEGLPEPLPYDFHSGVRNAKATLLKARKEVLFSQPTN